MTTRPPEGLLLSSNRRRIAVKPDQPGLCVCQTQAFAATRFENPLGMNTRAVVFNLNANHTISMGAATTSTRPEVEFPIGVSHRVLDNRLKDQIGNANVEHLRIDANVGRESILKAYALDLEIPVQKLDFLLQV